MPAIAEGIPPTKPGLLPVPFDTGPTPENGAIGELKTYLAGRAGFPGLGARGLPSHEAIMPQRQIREWASRSR